MESLVLLAVLVLCIVAAHRWLTAAARTRSTSHLHGDARFASPPEVEVSGLYGSDGILVGRHEGRDLVFSGQRFVLVAAPTRSGKGVGIVVPNLLTYQGSALVLDIKQENFALTAGWRLACGQRVYLFNPFAEDLRSHRYNPLDALSTDARFRTGEILAIGQVLYPEAERERFWNDQARNLFLGLVLYLCETPELPRTFGQVLREGSSPDGPLRDVLRDRVARRASGPNALSSDCRAALGRFLANGDGTLPGIAAAFNAPLLVFANPIVDAATSASDFSLADLRRERMTIYLGVPPSRLADASRLLNLIVAQLVQINTRALPDIAAGESQQCLLVLDEFAALGRIPAIVDAMPYLAAYQLRLLTIVQSTSQLVALYGVPAARTFVTNHALQVVFAPLDQRDAEDYSRALGTFTARLMQHSRSRSGVLGRLTRARRETLHARALLLPQEVKHMGAGTALILLENALPIYAQKIRYFEDSRLSARVLAPPDVPLLSFTR